MYAFRGAFRPCNTSQLPILNTRNPYTLTFFCPPLPHSHIFAQEVTCFSKFFLLSVQALTPVQRSSYAERWAELESALGRSAFHRLFNHVRTIQLAATAQQSATSNTSSTTHASNSSSSNGSTSGSSSSSLASPVSGATAMGFLQKGQAAGLEGNGVEGGVRGSRVFEGELLGGGGPTELLEHFGLACGDAQCASEVLNVLLEYGLKLLQIRQSDWKQLADEGDSGKMWDGEGMAALKWGGWVGGGGGGAGDLYIECGKVLDQEGAKRADGA